MALELYPAADGEEKRVRETARAFVDKHVRPTAIDDDRNAHFRRAQFDEAGKLGLASLLSPKEYGGGGHSTQTYLAGIEEVAKGSLAMAVTLGVTNLPQGAIVQYGNASQKEKLLRPLATGKWLGAFSLSEPQSGSDAAGLLCKAKKVSGGYELNGNKCWCSSAGEADLYIVMARTGEHRSRGISSFLVSKGTPGLSFGKKEDKLGIRSSPLGELVFENCFVAEDRLLGTEGQGLEVALSQLDSGRLAIGACAIGVCREALEITLAERNKDSDGMSDRLAELYARLQSIKLLLQEASRRRDQGLPITLVAAQLKLLASDLAMETTTACFDSFGIQGASPSKHLERLFRDAKSLPIVEGTNQIQKLVIAREMEKMS